ncbi:hypothetical protein MKW92_008686 [Papaver armeniacum]|nr:hypothetical protein MKW92_008686 [Papaver armeniacum]
MAKSSSLVFGFFFVALVVLQFASVNGFGLSPGDYGKCEAFMEVDMGSSSSCDECEASCSPLGTSKCLPNYDNEESYSCECCPQTSIKPHEEEDTSVDTAAATATATETTAAVGAATSIPLFPFSLFLSFILNMLYNYLV